jgi:hypothetical protein
MSIGFNIFIPIELFHVSLRNHLSFQKIIASLRDHILPSAKIIFGLKLHSVLNFAKGFLKYVPKPDNVHNVSYAEKILAGISVRMIGDTSDLSEAFKILLFQSGMRLIAKYRKNMEFNPKYERELLKK